MRVRFITLCLIKLIHDINAASHAQTFFKLGLIDVLIKLLRQMKDTAAQRNIAIVCAKLCQVGKSCTCDITVIYFGVLASSYILAI